MKKMIAITLALAMMMTMLAACGSSGGTEETTTQTTVETTVPAVTVEGTLEELLNKIVEEQPVEFSGAVMPIDLTDTTEDGLYSIKYYTGLDSADEITEAAAFEPMMGSIAFSMVMVRVNSEVEPQSVAQAMKDGIDPRKWICVQADDVLAAGYGDVVMYIMLDSGLELTAQSFVDAFQKVVGGELDFVI